MKRLVCLFLFLANTSFALTDLIDLAENANDAQGALELAESKESVVSQLDFASDTQGAFDVAKTKENVMSQLDFYFSNRFLFLIHKTDLSTKTTAFPNTYYWYKMREFKQGENDLQKILLLEEFSN